VFQHHTFVWQGIDGSEVLGHFPPADTYNSMATADELVQVSRSYLNHEPEDVEALYRFAEARRAVPAGSGCSTVPPRASATPPPSSSPSATASSR
jgi:hypothetical protein